MPHAQSLSSQVLTGTANLSTRARLRYSFRNVRSGVGFGICHRLLFQLSTRGQHSVSNELDLDCDGLTLTLILACRSKQRAEAARAKLYDIADELVRRAKCSPNYDGHAEVFRKNLHIAIHIIDLANIESIFRFADEVAQKYAPSMPCVHCCRINSLKVPVRFAPHLQRRISLLYQDCLASGDSTASHRLHLGSHYAEIFPSARWRHEPRRTRLVMAV